MSNHDVVLCRSFGDEPLVRLASSITKEGILICGQEYEASKDQQGDIVQVLAPFDAVYEYDEHLFHQLEKAFQNAPNDGDELEQLWQQARPYVLVRKEG